MQFTIHLNRFVILLLSTLTLIAGSAQAEEARDLPPWLTPSLAKKIVEIDMNSDQSCLLYTSPSPRDRQKSRMPSSA